MSERDWSYFASLGAIAFLGALAFIGPLVVRVDRPLDRAGYEQSSSEAIQHPERPSAVCTLHTDAIQRANCYREYADLEAQKGMKDAAWVGVGVGIASLVALIFTVIFARLAWQQAKRSADADNEALELTRTQLKEARAAAAAEQKRLAADNTVQELRFESQLAQAISATKAAWETANNASFIGRNQSRAYVHVSEARLDYTQPKTLLGGGFRPELLLKIENVGATPTKVVKCAVVPCVENFNVIYDGYRDLHHVTAHELGNLAPKDSQEVTVFVYKIEDVLEKDSEPSKWVAKNAFSRALFAIRGRIIYRDAFDKEHFSDFGFYCPRPVPGEVSELKSMTRGFARYEPYPPPDASPGNLLGAIIEGSPSIIDETDEK